MKKPLILVALLFSVLLIQTSSVNASPAYEDFTDVSWVEVDPNNHISVASATHIDVDGLTRSEDAYFYNDKGTDYFGDFEHLIDARSFVSSNYPVIVFWCLSNDIDDVYGLKGASKTHIYVQFGRSASGDKISLVESYSGSNYASQYVYSLNTWYYFRIKKTGTALTCRIWTSSSARDNNDTGDASYKTELSLTLQADHSLRYIFAVNSNNKPATDGVGSADIENLDLQEVVSVFLTFYFGEGGQFRLDNATLTNGTQYEYPNGTSLSWEFGALPFNVSWVFVNFTWNSNYNDTNPYNFSLTIYENTTVWCVFVDPPKFAVSNIPVLFIGALVVGTLIAFSLYLASRKKRKA